MYWAIAIIALAALLLVLFELHVFAYHYTNNA